MASDRGYSDLVLDKFELLYDLSGDQQLCPEGRSPNCYNVIAYPGRVASRPGFSNVASFASPSVTGIKEFVLPDVSQKRSLVLTGDAGLYKESGSYSYSLVRDELFDSTSNGRLASLTQFGREYFVTSDSGKVPSSMPLAYDDTNFDQVSPSRPAGAPTLANGAAGSVAAGTHLCRVCFVTRSGYITPPGPQASITIGANLTISVTNIPTGPAWVVGRLLAFTPVASNDFYSIYTNVVHTGSGAAATVIGMLIGDNTTTLLNNIDFTDAVLIAATPISVANDPSTDLLNLIELPSQTGVGTYHGRLCWFGERNTFYQIGDSGPLNMNFNGGWATNDPLGWTAKIAAGANRGSTDTTAYGDYLVIIGDGTNAKAQYANKNKVLGWSNVRPGVAVRARVRLKRGSLGGGNSGTFHVFIIDSSVGSNIGGAATTMSIDVSNTIQDGLWHVIDGEVLPAAEFTPLSTWELRFSSGGAGLGQGTALANSYALRFDYIELYQADKPYSYSQVRWSKPGQPDAYDAVFGNQTVGLDDGQAIRSAFALGDNYYFAKERSLYVTRDDGSSEPAFWPVSVVSNEIGTYSFKGIGRGDQWVVVASRGGLYFFGGGTPVLLTEEVQTTWNRINWQYGSLIWVEIDNEKKFIYVGVPLNSATTPDTILCFQWWGKNPLQGFQFNRWYLSDGKRFLSAGFSERSTGVRDFLVGTDHTSNNLSKLDTTVNSDAFGATPLAITSAYRTAFLGTSGKRLLTGRLTGNAKGSGSLNMTFYLPDAATAITPALPPLLLTAAPKGDFEYPHIRAVAERIALEVGMTGPVGSNWSLQRLAFMAKEKPFTGERGKRSY